MSLADSDEVILDTARSIIDSLWSQFEIEARSAVSTLREEDRFDLNLSDDFCRVLQQIKAHSKHCTNYLLRKLAKWRSDQARCVDQSSTNGCSDSSDSKPGSPGSSFELWRISVDIIYVRSVLVVIKPTKISRERASLLLNQSFRCFQQAIEEDRRATIFHNLKLGFSSLWGSASSRRGSGGSSSSSSFDSGGGLTQYPGGRAAFLDTPATNGRVCSTPTSKKKCLLFNLWCTVIGVLSHTQLDQITERLQGSMADNDRRLAGGGGNSRSAIKSSASHSSESSNHSGSGKDQSTPIQMDRHSWKQAQARLIRGMRSVKLGLSDDDSIHQSTMFISYLLDHFASEGTPSIIKRSVAETLTLTLYPLAEVVPTGSDSTAKQWWRTVYRVYTSAQDWTRRKKYHHIALPLCMVSLCVSEKEQYLTNRLLCTQALYKFIKGNSKPKYRTVGLACLRRILETYLKHFADGKTATETHLDDLNQQILGELKWQPKGEHQDGIVAYILTIAERKPEFALRHIAHSCLQDGAESKHALAGLRALNGILYGSGCDMLDENDVSNCFFNNNQPSNNHLSSTNDDSSSKSHPSQSDFSSSSMYINGGHSQYPNSGDHSTGLDRLDHDLALVPSGGDDMISEMSMSSVTSSWFGGESRHTMGTLDAIIREEDRMNPNSLVCVSDAALDTTYGPTLGMVLRSIVGRLRPVSESVLSPEIVLLLSEQLSSLFQSCISVMLRHGSVEGANVDVFVDDSRYLAMLRLCILCLPRIHVWKACQEKSDRESSQNTHGNTSSKMSNNSNSNNSSSHGVNPEERGSSSSDNNTSNSTSNSNRTSSSSSNSNSSGNGVIDGDPRPLLDKRSLILMLAQCSLSQHQRIANAAQHVTTYLMINHCGMRNRILIDYARYTLKQHGDNVKNIHTLLSMLNTFVTIWVTQLINEKQEQQQQQQRKKKDKQPPISDHLTELSSLDISVLEAAGVFWLCSTAPIVRQCSLRLIALCNELSRFQPKKTSFGSSSNIGCNSSSMQLVPVSMPDPLSSNPTDLSSDEKSQRSVNSRLSVLTSALGLAPAAKTENDHKPSEQSSKPIHYFGAQHPGSPTENLRMQDIIDATDRDIRQRLKHVMASTSFCIRKGTNRPPERWQDESESSEPRGVLALAEGLSADAQLEWTMCLGAILQRAVAKRAPCLRHAFSEARVHVDSLLRQLRTAPNDSSTLSMIGIWTNFILFVCVSVACIDPIPAAAEELFAKVLPLLNLDLPDLQFMGTLGLGKIEPSMILTLMKCLETIEHSVFANKKPKNAIRLLQNLAHIFRFLAEDVEPAAIAASETIRERLRSFVEKSMKFMGEIPVSTRPDCIQIRLHFCVIVRNLLEKWPIDLDGIDPISPRLRRKLFDFMIIWGGEHSSHRRLRSTVSASESHRSISNSTQLRNSQSSSQTHHHQSSDPRRKQNQRVKSLELKKEELEQAALAAVAALLRGPSFEEKKPFGKGEVFAWIRSVVCSNHSNVAMMGSLALQSHLRWNLEHVKEFIEECYHSSHIISKCFFLVLCEVWLNEPFAIPAPVLFHLVIFKMGDTSMRVRSAALKMGREIPLRIPFERETPPLNFIISSRLPDSYVRAQQDMSAQLASSYPSLSSDTIKEFGQRLWKSDVSNAGLMLQYMVPWLENIQLHGHCEHHFVMDILFRATVRFGNQFGDAVSDNWTALTKHEQNIPVILDYVVNRCDQNNHNPNTNEKDNDNGEFETWISIETAKRIALFCSRTCMFTTIQHLISVINQQTSPMGPTHRSGTQRPSKPHSLNNGEESNHTQSACIPEDPKTSLSTPAPSSVYRAQYSRMRNTIKSNKREFSPFQAPLLTHDQLSLVRHVGYNSDEDASDTPAMSAPPRRQPKSKQTPVSIVPRSADKTVRCERDRPQPSSLSETATVIRRRPQTPVASHRTAYRLASLGRHQRFNAKHSRLPKKNPQSGSPRWLTITQSDYALMLLVELAYEMDPSAPDFTANLAMLLHVAVLGMDHPFRSLGEHCKRLLMNLIHALHFRSSVSTPSGRAEAQQLLLFLVSKRGKPIWNRELIHSGHLFPLSPRYLEWLVTWLVRVLGRGPCESLALDWAEAALHWIGQSRCHFAASRSIQVYRALRRGDFSRRVPSFDDRVFDLLMDFLSDPARQPLFPDIYLLLSDWTAHIPRQADPSLALRVWPSLIVTCVSHCANTDPLARPHLYCHALSLLASVLQNLPVPEPINDGNNTEHESEMRNSEDDIIKRIWDTVMGRLPSDFEGVFNVIVKGLRCESTRFASEEFLSGLCDSRMSHAFVSRSPAHAPLTIVALLPSLCCYLAHCSQGGDAASPVSDELIEHLSRMIGAIATFFERTEHRDLCLLFRTLRSHLFDTDVSRFLSLLGKPLAQWISLSCARKADVTVTKLLLDCLDHNDTGYKRRVLQLLHGLLLNLSWDSDIPANSHPSHSLSSASTSSSSSSASCLSELDCSTFEKVHELTKDGHLWREATMILEVVIKFSNHSSEPPSMMLAPDGTDLMSRAPQIRPFFKTPPPTLAALGDGDDMASDLGLPHTRHGPVGSSLDCSSDLNSLDRDLNFFSNHLNPPVVPEHFQPRVVRKDGAPPFSPRGVMTGPLADRAEYRLSRGNNGTALTDAGSPLGCMVPATPNRSGLPMTPWSPDTGHCPSSAQALRDWQTVRHDSEVEPCFSPRRTEVRVETKERNAVAEQECVEPSSETKGSFSEQRKKKEKGKQTNNTRKQGKQANKQTAKDENSDPIHHTAKKQGSPLKKKKQAKGKKLGNNSDDTSVLKESPNKIRNVY